MARRNATQAWVGKATPPCNPVRADSNAFILPYFACYSPTRCCYSWFARKVPHARMHGIKASKAPALAQEALGRRGTGQAGEAPGTRQRRALCSRRAAPGAQPKKIAVQYYRTAWPRGAPRMAPRTRWPPGMNAALPPRSLLRREQSATLLDMQSCQTPGPARPCLVLHHILYAIIRATHFTGNIGARGAFREVQLSGRGHTTGDRGQYGPRSVTRPTTLGAMALCGMSSCQQA